ncbi:MAG: hypothetical protein AAF628_07520 [Planctomycetota bacterium]
MPTMLEAAGLGLPTERPLDGQSLVPPLRGEAAPERDGADRTPRRLYWKSRAMRQGRWKPVI